MRLTPTLLAEAPSYINPTKERILSLRSLQVPLIEYLDTTKDQFEAIDLTDNEIRILSSIPKLPKLKTLLLANNRINTIVIDEANELFLNLPNLRNLSLINNNLNNLKDLESLKGLKNLENLYLIGNPITKEKHYRLWCVWTIPSLKILDFEKIRMREREESSKLFGKSVDEPTDLAVQILNKERVDVVDTKESKTEKNINSILKKLSDLDRKKLESELLNADNLGEIERIETALQNGYI